MGQTLPTQRRRLGVYERLKKNIGGVEKERIRRENLSDAELEAEFGHRQDYKDHIKGKKIEFKPFGGWNYSYPEEWMRNSSFLIWALVTLGSLAVDWREAAIILGGSLWAQETIKNDGQWSSGASWVHNVQAGYCIYHWLYRGNKKFLVWLGSVAEISGDIVAASEVWGEFADDAHVEGLIEGFAAGFVFDAMFKKKRPAL